MGKNTYLKKGHKLDIKYLEIPEIFPQNHTIFDVILAKNVTSNFGAKLLNLVQNWKPALAYTTPLLMHLDHQI